MSKGWIVAKALFYILAFAGALFVLYNLRQAGQGLDRARVSAKQVPVEVFTPQGLSEPRPAVVIAHGFSVCKQYMYPFAYTLARNGYVAAVFDFSGHGKNPRPFPSDLEQAHTEESPLTADLRAALDYVRGLPSVDPGRVALIGYSMGSAVVTRYARDHHQEIAATIAVSGIFSDVLPAQPRNLLWLTGAWEMASLKAVARDALAACSGHEPGELSGDLAAGTACKLVFVPHAEHVTMPFNPVTLSETLSWLDTTFDHQGNGALDGRIVWFLLFYICMAVLFVPFTGAFLSRSAGGGEPVSVFWGASPLEMTGFLLVAVIPAIAVPLILSIVPHGLLPLVAGNYVLAFFWLYGMLMLILLIALRSLTSATFARLFSWRTILTASLLFLGCMATFGLLAETTVLNMLPTPRRWPIIGASLLIVLPYCTASEYISRTNYPRYRWVLPALVKMLFGLSLGIGIVLGAPFVLILFFPALILLFIGSGLFARRIYSLTGNPGISGLFTALIFAWLIGVIFPIT